MPQPRRDDRYPNSVQTMDDITGRDAWEFSWRLLGMDVLSETVRFPNNRSTVTSAGASGTFSESPVNAFKMLGDEYPYYLQAKEKLGGQCQVLAMRDSDVGFTTVFITQIDSPIRSLSDLNGKRFALASRDSSHAAILPLYFLHQNGLHPDTDLTLLRFDTDVGKHGDTGTSEEEVIRAVLNREADAGALGKATWEAYVTAGRIDPQKLRIFWTSPGYCHCNFTARADFPAELAHRFTQTILAMDYQQPEQKRILDLEGLTHWVPGRTAGYQELEDEARDLNMLS